jgi:hypothetical protein
VLVARLDGDPVGHLQLVSGDEAGAVELKNMAVGRGAAGHWRRPPAGARRDRTGPLAHGVPENGRDCRRGPRPRSREGRGDGGDLDISGPTALAPSFSRQDESLFISYSTSRRKQPAEGADLEIAGWQCATALSPGGRAAGAVRWVRPGNSEPGSCRSDLPRFKSESARLLCCEGATA